jgi:hypothetical protein
MRNQTAIFFFFNVQRFFEALPNMNMTAHRNFKKESYARLVPLTFPLAHSAMFVCLLIWISQTITSKAKYASLVLQNLSTASINRCRRCLHSCALTSTSNSRGCDARVAWLLPQLAHGLHYISSSAHCHRCGRIEHHHHQSFRCPMRRLRLEESRGQCAHGALAGRFSG